METEKQRERRERAESRAAHLHAKANEQFAHSGDSVKHIPFGQPILVGHHSERRHRKAIETAQRKTSQAVETYRAAQSAEWSASNAGYAITSDDPEALVALRVKLADLEAKQKSYKEINKAHKKGGWPAVVEAGLVTQETADKIETRCKLVRNEKPFPSYSLSNLSANIRRVKDRIRGLEAAATRPEAEDIEGDGFTIEEDKDDCRIKFYFDKRPDREVCRRMKQNGFRFSRTNGCWQRLLNENGRRAALSVAKELFGYEG